MTEFSDQKVAHLGMIQTSIARMAGESAKIKQAALVGIAALVSAATAIGSWWPMVVAVALIFVFWGLDAKYLSQERWFRSLYDRARAADGPANFVMTPDADIRAQHTMWSAMRGWSTAALYGAMVATCLLVGAFIAASPKDAPSPTPSAAVVAEVE